MASKRKPTGKRGGRPPRGKPNQKPQDRHNPYVRYKPLKKPKLERETTTLWEYPSQHYGTGEQGSSKYRGATPSWVIWQILQMKTQPGETILDPFCGSGTTLAVCNDLGRIGVGFDVAPAHDDVERADARDLPLEDASVDHAFFDPPYANNLTYSDDPNCIGKLSAHDGSWHEAMHDVFDELCRVVKPGGTVAAYLCDVLHARKGGKSFYPLGADLAFIGRELFFLRDHVAVVRKNKDLEKRHYHEAAREQGFLLRGFNHLLLFERPTEEELKRRASDR
jgi:SAM-dependent methyltransferase